MTIFNYRTLLLIIHELEAFLFRLEFIFLYNLNVLVKLQTLCFVLKVVFMLMKPKTKVIGSTVGKDVEYHAEPAARLSGVLCHRILNCHFGSSAWQNCMIIALG
jgi:hypothetical protein